MTLVFMMIRAEHGKIGIVRATMSKFDEIKEIYEVFGRFDLVAKIETKNSSEFKRFVKNKLRVMEGIKSIEPLFVADDDQEGNF